MGWAGREPRWGPHPSKMGRGLGTEAGGDFGWDSGLGDPGSLSQPLSEPQFLPSENTCNAGVWGVCVAGVSRRFLEGREQAWV